MALKHNIVEYCGMATAANFSKDTELYDILLSRNLAFCELNYEIIDLDNTFFFS
jgi:hypothetical protein